MNAKQTEKKGNNPIFNKDQKNNVDSTQAKACRGDCKKLNNSFKKIPWQCKCGVENSSRFSLRVMEALRLLQHDIDQPSTSTADEIINYIRSHYRHNGDLYAQVRTALRQVCSQGFVMELLGNEYHFVGSVANFSKRDDCSLDCKGRTTDFLSKRRRNVSNKRNGMCDCMRFPVKHPRQNSKSRSLEESLETSTVDRLENSVPVFHSTAVFNERDTTVHHPKTFNANDWNKSRNVGKTKQRGDHIEPIPGSSRRVLRISSPVFAGNIKKVEDKKVQCADETNNEDMDYTYDTEVLTQNKYSTNRPSKRFRSATRNQRNGHRHSNDGEDEKDNNDEDDKREEVEEDDEDAEEDNVYEKLRKPRPVRRRITARERELRNWIRRCREECERRRNR